MLEARCSNCVSWSHDRCAKGLAPAAGELLCPKYEMTAAFRSRVVGAVLKAEPVRVDLGRRADAGRR